ncbi:hypothetical protein ACIGO7_37930 [Streptomyces virginiae]|uniref:hypothetical protein n=1 Tax=Streptomyces virginiae TaxID=1961 RepID=UPI0037D92EA5
MTYAQLMEKATAALESARAILNDQPDERQIQRARTAIEIAEAYGSLARTASRHESQRPF